ncbi:tyrosine-type recombinase/integrase [Hyphococcus sp.]|uniref:tyrosine-type recombinase/integrase n=1 Tax=Hyphococcus sp. TaxID=2038636 RepID=UPI003CCB9D29
MTKKGRKSLPPIALTAQNLEALRDEILKRKKRGETIKIKNRFRVFRDGAVKTPLIVTESGDSILLRANVLLRSRGYMGYETLLKIPHDTKLINDNALDDALDRAKALAKASSTKTRAQSVADDRRKEQAKKPLRVWADEYYDLIAAHSNLKTSADRRSYISRFLATPLPADMVTADKKAFGDAYPGELDFQTVSDCFVRIAVNRSKHSARLTRSYVNSMFNYLHRHCGLHQDLMLPKTPPLEFRSKELVRNNPLEPDQLKAIWDATEKINLIEKNLVSALLLTARRRNELETLKWSNIDWRRGLIKFDAEDRKRDNDFIMPLMPAVADLLKSTPRLKDCDYVFPSSRGKKSNHDHLMRHIDHIILDKPYLSKEFAARGMKYEAPSGKREDHWPFDWRFHDFRDTAVQIMEDEYHYDWTTDDQDLLLGHDISGGKAQRKAYSTQQRIPRKKVLFARLESQILKIVEPEKYKKAPDGVKLSKEKEALLNKLSNEEIAIMRARLAELDQSRNI